MSLLTLIPLIACTSDEPAPAEPVDTAPDTDRDTSGDDTDDDTDDDTAVDTDTSEDTDVVPPQPFGLNDVSILFPLPVSLDAASLLAVSESGAEGVLLPQDVYDVFPATADAGVDALDYARLRVVALRFDRCGGPVGECYPQIRLVAQPLNDDGSTRDAAIHLFYQLDDPSFGALVDGLVALRPLAPETTPELPLQVHPSLLAQGVDGAFGQALEGLVLGYIGDANLVRVTFGLRTSAEPLEWSFGGYDRADGALTPIEIYATGAYNQTVALTFDDDYHYTITPEGLIPEDGHTFYSAAAMDAATESDRDRAMTAFLLSDNPTIYVADQIPCLTCHISTFATAEATRRHGLDPADFTDAVYTSRHDLTLLGGAAEEPRAFRAFGYLGRDVMIAQRTVNDSAAEADAIGRPPPE